MYSYYATLYAQTRPAAREQVSIGLIMASVDQPRQVRFAYSPTKLAIVRSLTSGAFQQDLLRYLETYQYELKEIKLRYKIQENRKSPVNESIFTETFLNYLANYHNNRLLFSKPCRIELATTESEFDWLFRQQVDPHGLKVVKSEKKVSKRFQEIRRRPIIREHFNRNFKVDTRINSHVIFPVEVDLFGRNGRDVFVKMIAMDRPNHFIAKDANSFIGLSTLTKGSKHFVISQEPDKRSYPKQYLSWEKLRSVPQFEYIDTTEIERLEGYAIEKNILPITTRSEEEE